MVFSSGVRHGHLRQELELNPEASILDTLYIGDSPAVLAMRNYESALSRRLEGDELPEAYDAMDAHEGWNFEARAEKFSANSSGANLDRRIGS